ncbi:uncharacterized protein LOC142331537 [Lycorma delicatula]|uniref:uncharacterized protein LOC142331537 n=1 Tax=Lycorma delicatula TaxID=130591 RepID=UPI003F50F146
MELERRRLMKKCILLFAVSLAKRLRDIFKKEYSRRYIFSHSEHPAQKLKKTRPWVKKKTNRDCQSSLTSKFVKELSQDDPLSCYNLLGINHEQFNWLLEKTSPAIQKKDTFMRDALPAHIKLKITLRYLITGDSFKTLSKVSEVPKNTISTFLQECMAALCDVLEDYIKIPDSEAAWNSIEKEFHEKWNFPNCYGSLGGKCVQIAPRGPVGSDSHFDPKHHKIIFFALVDANSCFTCISIESMKQISGGENFENTFFHKDLEINKSHILNNGVIIASDAFPLKEYLMVPYLQSNIYLNKQQVYNYYLLRALRTVENAFGILTSKFHIFERPFTIGIDKIPVLIKSCCSLHNWLKKMNPSYVEPGLEDSEVIVNGVAIPGSWREKEPAALKNVINFRTFETSISAQEKQNWFIDYFFEGCQVSVSDEDMNNHNSLNNIN